MAEVAEVAEVRDEVDEGELQEELEKLLILRCLPGSRNPAVGTRGDDEIDRACAHAGDAYHWIRALADTRLPTRARCDQSWRTLSHPKRPL